MKARTPKTKELAKSIQNESSTALQKVETRHELEYYFPKRLSRELSKVRTTDEAISADTDSIAILCKAHTPEKMEDLIKTHLLSLDAVLQMKNPLTEDQVDEIASEVVSSFRHLTMADIHVILRRAKSGEYGEFYERLSMPKILTWFRMYHNERVSAYMARNDREDARMCYVGPDEREEKAYTVKDIVRNIR